VLLVYTLSLSIITMQTVFSKVKFNKIWRNILIKISNFISNTYNMNIFLTIPIPIICILYVNVDIFVVQIVILYKIWLSLNLECTIIPDGESNRLSSICCMTSHIKYFRFPFAQQHFPKLWLTLFGSIVISYHIFTLPLASLCTHFIPK
jgi:hypothetical protein